MPYLQVEFSLTTLRTLGQKRVRVFDAQDIFFDVPDFRLFGKKKKCLFCLRHEKI